MLRSAAVTIALVAAGCTTAASALAAPPARRVPPRVQARPEPRHGVSFVVDDKLLLGLDGGAGMRRPFLYPVLGPTGVPLTRMGHPHDPVSHSHHNSVWIAHADVGGTTFWADDGGTIEVARITRLEDGDDRAAVELEAAWRAGDAGVLLRERRRVSLVPLAADLWRIDVETELRAADAPVPLGATAFGMLAVRVARSIGVKDGGGRIVNSEGSVNEAGCFRKPARWVDYTGPVTATVDEGITLMDHPDNLHHPVEFHVRDDGWMGAATTFRGGHTIEPAAPLRLRHGLLVHGAATDAAAIEREWKRFAAVPFQPFAEKPK
jgi:hypothetical protein